MITLVRELYGRYFGRPRYNVLVVGLDGQGKTKLLNACKKLEGGENRESDDSKIIPTTGLNTEEKQEAVDAEHSKLRLWDLGGRRDLQKIWSHYYQASHALIFVVRVKALVERQTQILSCFGTRRKYSEQLMKQESLKDIPVVVVLNEDTRVTLPPTINFQAALLKLLTGRPHRFQTVKLPNYTQWFPYCRELEGCFEWLEQQLLNISKSLDLI